MYVWLALIGLAMAAVPDGGHAQIDLGSSGAVDGLSVSDAGGYVAGVVGTEAFILDLESWEHATYAGCSAGAATVGDELRGSSADLLVACTDGTVKVVEYASGSLTEIEGDRTVGATSSEAAFFDVFNGDLYIVGTVDGQHAISIIDTVSAKSDADHPISGFPVAIRDGYSDAAIATDGNSGFIAHGGRDLSSIAFGSSVVSSTLATQTSARFEDITANTTSTVLGTDSSANALWLGTVGQSQPTQAASGLDGPTAVAASIGLDGDGDWIYVAGDTHFAFDATSGGSPKGGPVWSGQPTTDPIEDLVAVADGYVIGAGSGGILHVLSANPLLTNVVVSPSRALEGVEVSVSFDVNEAVDFTLYQGGNRTGTGGNELAAGSTDDAASVSASFVVDSAFSEGDNDIWIVARDADGNVGHAKGNVEIDNPPDSVMLTDEGVGFADRALVVSFRELEDPDIIRYDIYITTVPFERTDYLTGGGPAYEGPDAISSPYLADTTTDTTGDATTDADDTTSTTEEEDDGYFSVRITGLTNGVEYYVAVRAVDSEQEGGMSAVISEIPRKTYGAADLAGIKGGGPCSCSTGAAGAPWLAVVALAGLLRRRRGLAGLLLALLLAPSTGLAQEAKKKKWTPERDLTPVVGNVEIRYGNIRFEDNSLKTVYGRNDNNMFYLEGGPQWYQVLELDVGIGYLREHDQQVDGLLGSPGADASYLRFVPLSLDVSLHGHILDEQILVPFIRYGVDYAIWDERLDNGTGDKDRINGAMVGNHSAWGLAFLLDPINKGRSSLLEAQTGINDSFIIVEVRRQYIDRRKLDGNVFQNTSTLLSRSGKNGAFHFDGRVVTVGFKFDY